MRNVKIYFILSLLLLLGNVLFAQAPINDDCSGAISIPLTSGLVSPILISGSTENATQSMASCGTGASADDDVWFKFVATQASHIVKFSNISVTTGTSDWRRFEIFDACAGTSLYCTNLDVVPSQVTLTNLVPSQTYYIRYYTYNNNARHSFDISILTPPSPPANDECTTATLVPINTGLTPTLSTSGTTAGATQSLISCGNGAAADDDVWFKFVATQTSHIVTFSNVSVTYGTSDWRRFEVFDACGGNSLYCTSAEVVPNQVTLTNLVPNQTYYIRYYSYNLSTYHTFDISILSPPLPPINDECTTATLVPINTGLTPTLSTSGTTAGATQSLVSCGTGAAADDDVWFKFVATQASHILKISNVGATYGTSTWRRFEVFDACGGASLYCTSSDVVPTEVTLSNLVPNQTYYIRYYSYNLSTYHTFDISILTPPLPPANDDCSGATSLAVNGDLNPTLTTSGTTAGATQSLASCGTGAAADDDVWFKFVATQASHIVKFSNVAATYGTSVWRRFEAFDACGGNSLNCTSTDVLPNQVKLTNLVPNQTYYIRYYSYNLSTYHNFDIAVLTPPAPPINDECSAAVQLPVNTGYACDTSISGSTAGATQSLASCGAGTVADDDVWFKFTAHQSSQIVNFTNIVTNYGTSNWFSLQVLDACNGNSIFCSNGALPTQTTLNSLTPYQEYYIRVYSADAISTIDFNICILTPVPPPSNDECTSAMFIVPSTTSTCTSPTSASTAGATQSQAPCTGSSNDDVWFSFIASQANHTILINNVIPIFGTSDWRIVQVLDGCSGNTIYCSTNVTESQIYLSNLVPTQNYLIRIHTYGLQNSINFDLCVVSPVLPANDECSTAMDITSSSVISETTAGATSSNIAAPLCNTSSFYNDIWYKVVAPTSGDLSVVIVKQNLGHIDAALYQGTCSSLVEVDCQNDFSYGSDTLFINNAVQNQAYFVRVSTNRNSVANFSIKANPVPLPTALLYFDAVVSPQRLVELRWETSENEILSGFEIEKSEDGALFKRIAFVSSQSDKNLGNIFKYQDEDPISGKTFYRLKQLGIDGSFDYSNVLAVNWINNLQGEIGVYPNPTKGKLEISIPNWVSPVFLSIYTADGRIVHRKIELMNAKTTISVEDLENGIYFIKLGIGDKILYRKFLKN